MPAMGIGIYTAVVLRYTCGPTGVLD
ncbi:hypothetical protein EMIT0P176_40313 [Pseudomonas sp. IT-P176]